MSSEAASGKAKSKQCPSCGVRNSPVAANGRCTACGAVMEQLQSARTPDVERARRYQQEGFNVVWCGIAIGVQAILTGALIIGLPMVVSSLDFEGSNGMVMTIPVWFLGGMLVGMISPGRTFVEPVAASFLTAIPTVLYLAKSQTVRTMPFFMYVIMAVIGVLFTLVGAYIGERIQLGPQTKTAD